MKLLGQGDAFALALRRARRLQLHHALLVSGARGAGKSTAALQLAQALLCEAGTDGGACGRCSSCARVETHNHPDFHELTVAEDKTDISVDQVRGLQAQLGRHAMEGRARVVVVDPADRLTEQAQNALLKTLEEPGADTFLILTAARPEALLPTVRSRVNRLHVLPLDRRQVEEALAQLGVGSAETRRTAATRAAGSVGFALELLEQDAAALQQSLVAFIARPIEMSAIGLARAVLQGVPDRAAAERRARIALSCARAVLRDSLGHALAESSDATYLAATHAPWVAVFECLFDAELDLALRIAPEQCLSNAFLRMQEELPRLGDVTAPAASRS